MHGIKNYIILVYPLCIPLILICRLWGIDVKTFSDIGNRILISEP